jgi:hypothetical protein
MALVAELAEISRQECRGENWRHFTAVLSRMSSALGRLEAENDLSQDLETLRVLSMG